jgi:translation initiation factor IF-3
VCGFLEVKSIARDMKVNDQIRVRQVRLIDAEGTQQGIVDTRDALRMAREQDLDLVLVGEQAQPPVARLMDFGRYRYELQQQAKDARKRSKSQEMKSIKFRVKIDRHDYQTKVNHIRRFLRDGHKVKVTIMFRGRERTHPELGQEILNRVAADTTQLSVIDAAPVLAGMDMNMVLRPSASATLTTHAPGASEAAIPAKPPAPKPKPALVKAEEAVEQEAPGVVEAEAEPAPAKVRKAAKAAAGEAEKPTPKARKSAKPATAESAATPAPKPSKARASGKAEASID